MTDKLLRAISDTELLIASANEIEEAVSALSSYPLATADLVDEIRRLVVDAERRWLEIEKSNEFKANFSNRTQAIVALSERSNHRD